MKVTGYTLLVTLGLTRGAINYKSFSNAISSVFGNGAQHVEKATDEGEKEKNFLADKDTPQLLSKLTQSSKGSTPEEIAPSRFNPASNHSEYVASHPHSEAEAYRMVDFCGLAYCLEDSIKSLSCKACKHIRGGVEVLDIFTDSTYKGRSVLMLDNKHKQIVLIYRGSIFLSNWIEDFKVTMDTVPYAKDAKVIIGFKQMHQALFGNIIGPLKKTLDEYPSWPLIITGHSLGGSLSTMMASELLHRKTIPHSRLNVITFGEQRVGNVAFVRWYNSQPVRITRVVNENDVIPHYVPTSLGYVHHATELYIHNNKTRICSNDKFEDPTCSLSRYPYLSIISHNKAWDLLLGLLAC
ncbi:hypothetical protein DSO57_1025362 [Entomophthora muscae]|uniref:Uncharacterized protein n=1 Tax=Entomophthora muscae TaxID=34485 RepID=A0ACC2TDU8_9FUNG|nr:hypothetical protein DSO57_1025362 [Entomophthora muscae]